jgi:thioredoxin 1
MTVKATDSSFEQEVLKSDTPVLVDFWAEWCGPCKMIGPSLEEIAKDMDGKLKIVKINIDENPMAPTRYGVRSIPTLLLFKNGQVTATKIGAEPKQKLVNWINTAIAYSDHYRLRTIRCGRGLRPRDRATRRSGYASARAG